MGPGFYSVILLVITALQADPKPLDRATYDEIRKRYLFIGDFSTKPAVRSLQEGIFWRYPLKMPKPQFPIHWAHENNRILSIDFPATPGVGRAFEHLNRGRLLFLRGQTELSRQTLLSLRARYGNKFAFHRRNDYFLGNIFLKIVQEKMSKLHLQLEHKEIKPDLSNAATFLSWAYLRKKEFQDPLLDKVAPLNYYNLGAIYYQFNRFGGAYGAAREGLNFLNRHGRDEYRGELRRLVAELMIKNQDYTAAVQEFDTMIRQDSTSKNAGKIFARVADIYFGLNNYELAENLYSIANRIDQIQDKIEPYQFVLRGESLFWLGKFDKAQKMLHYGLESFRLQGAKYSLPLDLAALANLRIADAWLAKKEMKKAKIQYFRHTREFRNHPTRLYAKLRLACLELPFYNGKNISHGRKTLSLLKNQIDRMPAAARQLAWTCETSSYAQHERSQTMVERVRKFSQRYPQSDTLKNFIEPVRSVEAKKIFRYFKDGDLYGALDFFEKTRSILYPKISLNLKRMLFNAYLDTDNIEKANEFWLQPQNSQGISVKNLIREAVFLTQKAESTGSELWQKRNKDWAKILFEHKISVTFFGPIDLYLARILAAKSGVHHYPWIMASAEEKAKNDFAVVCEIIYPMLADSWDRLSLKSTSDSRLLEKISDITQNYLPKVIRFDSSCGHSLIEFEMSLYDSRLESYALEFMKRKYIPFDKATAKYYWHLAEGLHQMGSLEKAQEIWQYIVKKGNAQTPEVRYANNRLQFFRTELEDLWR